ncbi:MAG: TIM-barrel domain-containing protein [Terriglobales bacterium]
MLRTSHFALRTRLAVIAILLIAGAAFAQDNPLAAPKAIVVSGHARFTVLTPRLIRMEWAEDGKFEDRASLVFINRRLPAPAFKSSRSDDSLTIDTGKLLLRYRASSGQFTADNLEVSFDLNGSRILWHPGMPETGNLGGTIRTLDGVKGSTPLGQGLVSRDGWVVIDDSARPLFDHSDWPWAVARPAGRRQDWYFFGYGHDYKKALGDYVRVAGTIPLPPRFAFGTWWSRYWAYSDEEFKDLVNQFREHDVPLDVLVIDMDWHPTFGVRWWENKKDPSGHTLGWTGYTWNNLYFPDPTGFLAWAHQQGLKTTLNMHPASGVQPFEKQYPEMAHAMGVDPATKQYVPFDIADKKFATNYMNILHHPFEKQGVDFFWLDWQQEPNTRLPGLNNTWWLNYVHFTDMEREGKRPLLFHRWGGLGNHRYQIGFSGDTISVWESLAFQPYFTATAANVGYGYWSHDIGGHMPGAVTPELYTRWIQFGVFSPILRTHTTKNPQSERRIWAYPEPYAEIMRDSFLLRYALIPYIYTAARQAYDTGISLLRPLYYDWPDAPEAYEFKNEYMFGDDMLVAPVTAELSLTDELAHETVWLPPGTWIEWFTGAVLQGPAKMERNFGLDEIPVYVRAGAIIPEQPKMLHTGERPVDPLILNIFPGEIPPTPADPNTPPPFPREDYSTRIYADAGDTLGYKSNEFTWTEVRQTRKGGAVYIEILPVSGSYPGMPAERAYEIRLPCTWPPQWVKLNNDKIPFSRDGAVPGWHYDGDHATIVISLPRQPVSQRVNVSVAFPPYRQGPEGRRLLYGLPGKIARLKHAMALAEMSWPNGWAPDVMLDAVQTGNRISLHPETAYQELERLESNLPEVITQLQDLEAELLKMPDNGQGFGFGPREQLAAVRRAMAHLAAK